MSMRGDISVLIADSDLTTRAQLRHCLSGDGRFGSVAEVSAGDDAVRLAAEADVVVIDLHSVNGLGALGTIVRIQRQPAHPPVVGLARSGDFWLEQAALTEGAVDVAEWPADGTNLGDRLVQAARSTG
jgi:CheY-like chemotaxis protein